jgi:CRISPR-associated endonuclease/helicase Cas3
MNALKLADCWAKTDEFKKPAIGIVVHCLSVGSVAKELSEILPSGLRAVFPVGGVCLIAAHDVGKISPGFLMKSGAWMAQWRERLGLVTEGHETRHAWTSQKVIALNYEHKPPRWIIALGGHHGRYLCAEANPAVLPGAGSMGSGVFEDLRQELMAILEKHFGPLPEPEEVSKGAKLHWFTGAMIFCDWIGSNTTWFQASGSADSPEKFQEIARSALEKIGIHRTGVKACLGFGDLFGIGPARPLQEALVGAMDSPGLYIVEAPMGGGKTEAALAGAYRRWSEGNERGLFFALPTQLTSNRIRDRVEDFFKRVVSEESSLALAHGNAWLLENRIRSLQPQLSDAPGDSDNASEANAWFSDNRRAMLAPFGVGTIDQALMAVVPVKHSALRMFGLGGKVVVIDEVHSYDPFTSALVDRLVSWLIELGGAVIVLSATLTAARRGSLVAAAGGKEETTPDAYPLLTKVATGNPLAEHYPIATPHDAEREVGIRMVPANDELWMNEVASAARNGACVLVIRNTVALSQASYRALKAHCPESGIEFGLIHSRFTQADRENNETRWTGLLGRDGSTRPKNGAVLVGTQVLEQSLDIDADLLVTDLAPTDLVLQRIGRLHRHQRRRPAGCEKPICIILRPDVNWTATRAEVEKALAPHHFIYPPFSLYMADKAWSGTPSIRLPSGIRSALEKSADGQENHPPAINEFREEMDRKTERMRQAAWMNGIFKSPAAGDTEGAETRWNIQPSAWIVVLAKPPSRSGRRMELAFPDGTTRSFDEAAFDFPLARSLQLHAVRVPAYVTRGLDRPAWLSSQLSDAVLAVKDETNRLCMWPEAAGSYEFTYSPETGLGFSKTQNNTGYTPEENDSWY